MELYLPKALVTSKWASYLADKAIKRARMCVGEPSCMVVPKGCLDDAAFYRLTNEAALNGLLCVCREGVPEASSPFVAYADGESLELHLPAGLCDCHAHTQFAYCGRGIDLLDAAQLSELLGVQTQCFTEHAFALYFGSDALKFKWQNDEAQVARAWADPGHVRMKAYRELIATVRPLLGGRVKFGLEVDLLKDGKFCLAPEDYDGWDYLIGAVHEIADVEIKTISDAELEKKWLRDVEALLAQPIRILAHPFRYFPWYNRAVPRHLYKPVAKMLKQAGVAAEINHHKNAFEVEFFAECLSEGVQLSLGSDAHVTRQAGDLWAHLKTLEALGLDTAEKRAAHVLAL
jgi:histidinol phosphatase-like PHP family hydrolase